jgi:hypothetical protein
LAEEYSISDLAEAWGTTPRQVEAALVRWLQRARLITSPPKQAPVALLSARCLGQMSGHEADGNTDLPRCRHCRVTLCWTPAAQKLTRCRMARGLCRWHRARA